MVDIQANHIDFIINMTNLWKIPRLRRQLIHEIKGLNMEFLNKRDYLIKVLKAQGLDYNMLRAYRLHYMCKLI
jgi:hypothetical protein